MPSCEGRLVKAHLIRGQVLFKELPAEVAAAVYWSDPGWVGAWGGLGWGNAGHHGAFDESKRIRVERAVIPRATEEFADRWVLTWWLDRTYGVRDG